MSGHKRASPISSPPPTPQATNVPPGVSERNEAGSPSPWVVARAWMAEWVEGGREGGREALQGQAGGGGAEGA